MVWQLWWAWVVGGLALGILEIFAPGFVFLGFSAGAVLTGIVLLVLPGLGLPKLALIFAIVSLLVWLGLRWAVGIRVGQVKVIDRDVNDN